MDAFEQYEKRQDERHEALKELLREQFKSVHEKLDSRPCVKHEQQIGALFAWQRRRDELTAYWKGVAASALKISTISGSVAGGLIALFKTDLGHRIILALTGTHK